MKKRVLIVVFVLAPLLSVMAGTPFVSLGEANFLWPFEVVPPDEYAKAPVISIFSPENNTVFNRDNIVLSFKVDLGESETDLEMEFVRYETDWQHDNLDHFLLLKSSSFAHKVNLTGIPEGTHSIAFQAIESGTYKKRSFNINSSETIYFTIDTSPETKIPEFPSWTILPIFTIATLLIIICKHKHYPKQATQQRIVGD